MAMHIFVIDFARVADISATTSAAFGVIAVDVGMIVIFAACLGTDKSIPIRIVPEDA